MDKSIMTVKVASNECIAEGVWKMILEYPQNARPGQFVNLYMNSKEMLLPRPISICSQEKDQLTLVYGVVGRGTKQLSSYKCGTKMKVSTPLGNGYDIDGIKGGKAVLIGGGIGIPPLLELSNELLAKGLEVQVVLGYRKAPFLVDEFLTTAHIATEEGTAGFHGNVVELIKEMDISADYYFACGPRSMLKAVYLYLSSRQEDVQVSMEERMGCGYGACLGCTCKISGPEGEIKHKKVCTDGPVFWGRDVVWNE